MANASESEFVLSRFFLSATGYLKKMPHGKAVLWSYLLWYLNTVFYYFDPNPMIWLNSLGISAVIGIALMLSVSSPASGRDGWVVFRLFLMPFCVSSFSSLIKGRGYVFIMPPTLWQNLTGALMVLGFWITRLFAR